MKLLTVALLLVTTMIPAMNCLPLSKYDGIFITSDNVRFYASYVDNSLTVYDTRFFFGSGSSNEELLRVPLAEPGELNPHAIIKVTVAYDPDAATSGTDHDPRIGISDGTNINQFIIYDSSSVTSYSPCTPYSASHEANRITELKVAGQVTMTFDPFHQFGSCYTAQDGGYVNTAKFNYQVDITKGLDLVILRHSSYETYSFYYVLVEILQ